MKLTRTHTVSYAGFWTLVLETLRRLRTEDPSFKLRRIFSNDPAMRLFGLINLSSIFVMIRSIFRIIEMVQGYSGFLASRESELELVAAVPLK
jgi:RTA1 like protein